ncbi:MAG: excinuclease ABC subunit UvrC [Victivallaceae bacterium]|nr:excinuclease ABC subunit UvrC [Victivallaceae bacterium]
MMKRPFASNEVPHQPGVYVYRDRFGTVIYVGKARDLKRRMSSYFQPSRMVRADAKLRSLVNSIDDWSFEVVRTEDEALILESRLIKDFAPYYNILMRDDKRYLMLKCDLREKYPTFRLARIKRPGAIYFGPFPNGTALHMTLDFLLRYFRLKSCKCDAPNADNRKHCLKHQVRDCSSPCDGSISEADYRAKVEQVLALLEGSIRPLVDKVKEEMLAASAEAKYEKAAMLRDVMVNLTAVFGRKNRSFENPELPGRATNADATELAQLLGIPVPEEIVCFDNSHLFGTYAVGSMVLFRHGRPDRGGYRRFRIRNAQTNNDFAMMTECVSRALAHRIKEGGKLPDLIVIDGGKEQLKSAIAGMAAANAPPVPIIALAKREEEIYVPGREIPFRLDRHDGALRLIQSLRDEAHRFAVGYNRQLRQKRISESALDEIGGIGPHRKTALLRAFGSVNRLRKASADEIAAQVPGIGVCFAEKLLARLGAMTDPPPEEDSARKKNSEKTLAKVRHGE